MTEDQITLLAIKGAISELPPDQALACGQLIQHIKQMMNEAGSPVGEYAIAYIGAELQMDE